MRAEEGIVAGLHFRASALGAGEIPLLILPGLLGDGLKLRRLAEDLGRGRAILFVDPLGGGGSEVPVDPAEYGWPAQSARLLALLDALELERVDVLGVSLGGMWAQHALLCAPARFRRAVLASTAARAQPRLQAMIRSLAAQAAAGVDDRELARLLLVLLFSPSFLDRPGVLAFIEESMSREPLPRASLLRQLAAIGAHDRGESPGLPGQVSRILVGEHDFLTHPGDAARLARLLPGSEVEILPGTGHCAWVERPSGFAEAVLRGLS